MAIAVNTRDGSLTSSSGSTSVSETFVAGSGPNRLLGFFTLAQSGNPSTLTWNTSESGTNDKTEYDPAGSPGTTNYVSVGHRLQPSAGSKTAAATKSDNTGTYYIACADYTGVKQTGQPDATASGTAGAGSTSISYSITTVAADCWVLTSGWATGGTLTSGTNCTFFANDGSRGAGDSNGSVGAAGSKTVNFTSASGRLFGASASFSPGVNPTGNFLNFM